MRRFTLCFSLAVSLVAASAATTPPKSRLAEVQSVDPVSYKAELSLDPGKNTFTGSIVIRMNVQKPTDTLWLNQEKIAIRTTTVRAGGKQLAPSEIIPGGDDFVGLHFAAPLPAGDATATIDYSGVVIEKNSIAIFRQQEGGNWYIFSQFESTDARGAFPCFDEPSFKTPWQLTLHIPQGDSAVSNTPVASETPAANGMKTVVFKETKPLPSYLVAFAVGPFEYVDAGTVGKAKVPIRIVVPKGKSGEAKYAAEVTAPILNRLEEYFGIPFPYEKSDQVAIPDTSGWGAMENPGMVTYQQNIILADPKVDRLVRQRNYVETAAHELAHQWFGDLVTTAWWDDIWLNESFATWMERKIVAEWKPEWNTRVVDVTDKLGVEREDSLVSARRIRQPIVTKDDINNAFDGITYQKGSAVIGMFENWMGPDEFRKGVQSYLKRYAFKATTAGDFLDSLSSSSQRNVTTAFSTFLNQAGAPLLSVELDCKGPKPVLNVTQKRFVPLGSPQEAKNPAPQTWSTPLCFRYGSGTTGTRQCALISQPAQTVTIEANNCPAWVQANDGANGYYHVSYAPGMVAALTEGDVLKRLSATERADLMGNALSLSSAGLLPVAESLALVEVFHDDPSRNVLELAVDTAVALRHSVPANLIPNYERFMAKAFGARAKTLGWTPKPGEDEDTRLERPFVMRAMSTAGGDKALAAEARALAEKWLADHSAVSTDLRNAVLASAGYNGDKTLFEHFLGAFKASGDRQIRAGIAQGMYWMRDPGAIDASLTAIVRGDIPFIEGTRIVISPERDADGAKQTFAFMKAHFEEIVARMPSGGGFDFGSVLPEVGGPFCDAQSRDDLKTFFTPHVSRFAGAPRALDQAVEGIDLCIARRSAQAGSVAQFLQKY